MSDQATQGTTFGVSTTLPDTFDVVSSTGYPSETYLTAGNVENFPEFGESVSDATSNPVNGAQINKPGQTVYPRVDVQITYDEDDTGHAALEDNVKTECAFAITYPDGAIDYVTGYIMGFRRIPGGANDMVMANVEIRQNRPVVRVDAS